MAHMPEKISEDTLCLLYSLFISNIPQSVKDEWKNNFVRIFAELEWAHWFYLDNCLKDSSSGAVDFLGFCQQFFDRFPLLVPKKTQLKEKILEWKRYRGNTATGSAIILDEYLTMVLLVQGFNNDRWVFPGGKINQNETLQQCAIREVMEETGLDIEHRLDPNIFIDTVVGETKRRAFIVEGFPRMTNLLPSTRNEIEVITWFNISNLPCSLQDETPMLSMKLKSNCFFCIVPFVKQLRLYIKCRRAGMSCAEALARSEAPQDSCEIKNIPSHITSELKDSNNAVAASLLPPAAFKVNRKARKTQSISRQPSQQPSIPKGGNRSNSTCPPTFPKDTFLRPCDFRQSSASPNPIKIGSQPTAMLFNKPSHSRNVASVEPAITCAPPQSPALTKAEIKNMNKKMNFLHIPKKTEPTLGIWRRIRLDGDALLKHFVPVRTLPQGV